MKEIYKYVLDHYKIDFDYNLIEFKNNVFKKHFSWILFIFKGNENLQFSIVVYLVYLIKFIFLCPWNKVCLSGLK